MVEADVGETDATALVTLMRLTMVVMVSLTLRVTLVRFTLAGNGKSRVTLVRMTLVRLSDVGYINGGDIGETDVHVTLVRLMLVTLVRLTFS